MTYNSFCHKDVNLTTDGALSSFTDMSVVALESLAAACTGLTAAAGFPFLGLAVTTGLTGVVGGDFILKVGGVWKMNMELMS